MVTKTEVDNWKDHLKGGTSVFEVPQNVTHKDTFDWVEVEHGLTPDGDYAWHFSNAHRSKPLPNKLTKIYQIIATYLDRVIPDEVTVDVYPPPESWEKKVITVIARGIGKKWNFDEDNMKKPLAKIGELVTAEINLTSPRKILR